MRFKQLHYHMRALLILAQTFRNNMRTLGVASSVPIEPPEQTRLLDDIAANCVGVLGGGVPGGAFSISPHGRRGPKELAQLEATTPSGFSSSLLLSNH